MSTVLTHWQELGFFALGHPEVRFHSQHCGLSHHFSAYFSLFKGLIFNVVTTAFVCPNSIKKYCWTSTVSNIAFSLSGWVYTHAVRKVSTAQTADYCSNPSAVHSLHCVSTTCDHTAAAVWGTFWLSSFFPVKLVPLTSPHLQLLVITISENESLKQTRKCCQSCASAQLHKLMLCSEDAVKNSFAPLFALIDQDEHLQEEEQRWRASKKDRFI